MATVKLSNRYSYISRSARQKAQCFGEAKAAAANINVVNNFPKLVCLFSKKDLFKLLDLFKILKHYISAHSCETSRKFACPTKYGILPGKLFTYAPSTSRWPSMGSHMGGSTPEMDMLALT